MATRKSGKAKQSFALPDEGKRAEAEDTEHGTLVRYVNDADDASKQSRELSEKSRNYFDSIQWTDAEVAKLKSQKQAPTVINRIKPKIDGLMGMEHANRTTAKAKPRTPKHTKGALAATEAVRFVMHDNMYSQHRSDAWENLTIEGAGGIEVIVKPKKDEDGFKIIVRQIMWDRLIWDPHSRRKDFSDAKYLGQVVWMDYEDALAMYPEAEDVLESMQAGSRTYDDKPRWMDTARKRVKIVELYYRKKDGDWWYSCFTLGGYCKKPMKSPYVNEEGESEHCYEFASLFVDRDGGRYGAVKQLLDVQDEINKRRSKALHLMSVRQTFGTKGSVEDVNKARQELAKPDGHVEFAYGEFGKDFGILPTGDMAQAQFNLLTEAKMEIDSVGANAATMGKDKTVQSGVALHQRALTGQTELAPMFDVLKHLDLRVYRKIWNRIKQYWKEEMWLRVTDDEQNLKFVGLNRKMTKGEVVLQGAQEQKLPPEALAALQQRVSTDPTMQEPAETQNDIVHLDVDIIMSDVPDTVTQEVEDFQAMAEMVKSGFPLPPKAVIMSSPLSNKEQILKMMDESPQLPPEHVEQMKKMEDDMKKLAEENQALKQDQQTEVAKLKLSEAETRAQLDLQKVKQDGEIELARAKAEAEFALKKWIAEQEAGLETERLEREKVMGEQKMALERRKAESDSLPPEIVETYKNNKVIDDHAVAYEAKLEEKQMQSLSAIQEQLQALSGQVEQALTVATAPKPTVTGAKALRNKDGSMRAVQVSKSDGTVEEIPTMLQ